MFAAPGLIFGGTEGVGSRFHVLRSRTQFRRYRVRRVPVFLFCSPVMVFDGAEGFGFRIHVLRAPDSFSAVPSASGPIFMFCATGLVFDGTEEVGSRFHVLRSWTHFRRYRGRRVPFSCFALSESFSAVPRSSGPIFMFCVPVLIFEGAGGDVSRIHVLRARTRFRRYRVRWVPFSCFALPDSFSMVPRASCALSMYYAPGLVFDGTEGVGSCFHVLSSQTRFRRYRGRRVPFSCFALP
jgi:hypothetical protein